MDHIRSEPATFTPTTAPSPTLHHRYNPASHFSPTTRDLPGSVQSQASLTQPLFANILFSGIHREEVRTNIIITLNHCFQFFVDGGEVLHLSTPRLLLLLPPPSVIYHLPRRGATPTRRSVASEAPSHPFVDLSQGAATVSQPSILFIFFFSCFLRFHFAINSDR